MTYSGQRRPLPTFQTGLFWGGRTPATHRMHAGTPSSFSHTGYHTFELSCVWRCVIPPQPAKWHNSSVDGRAPNRFEVACSPSGCVESFPLPVAVIQPPLTPPTFSDRRSICNRISDCCSQRVACHLVSPGATCFVLHALCGQMLDCSTAAICQFVHSQWQCHSMTLGHVVRKSKGPSFEAQSCFCYRTAALN